MVILKSDDNAAAYLVLLIASALGANKPPFFHFGIVDGSNLQAWPRTTVYAAPE